MPPFFIAVIVVGIVSLLIVWHINTNIDRIKKKTQAKIVQHKEVVARYQRIYDRIPSNYLSRDVSLVILNELIEHLQEWAKLDSSNAQVKAHLDKRLHQKQDAMESTQKPSITDTNDSDDAAEIRRRLMELHKFILMARKTKKMNKPVVQKELQTIKQLFVETGTNTFINLAKQAMQREKPRLAIHYYGRALAEYQKSNADGQFNGQIKQLSTVIRQLQGKPQKAEKEATQEDESGSELAKAMDDMMAEEEGQKKMTF